MLDNKRIIAERSNEFIFRVFFRPPWLVKSYTPEEILSNYMVGTKLPFSKLYSIRDGYFIQYWLAGSCEVMDLQKVIHVGENGRTYFHFVRLANNEKMRLDWSELDYNAFQVVKL